MTENRQEIINAIRNGHCTPKEIGKELGKNPQTVSKTLYIMKALGLIKQEFYGKYSLNDSIEIETETGTETEIETKTETETETESLSKPKLNIGISNRNAIIAEVEKALKARFGQNQSQKSQDENAKLNKRIVGLEKERDDLQIQLVALEKKSDELRVQLENIEKKSRPSSESLALVKKFRQLARQTDLVGKKKVPLPDASGKTIGFKYVDQFCELIRLLGIADIDQSRASLHDHLVNKFKNQDVVSARQLSEWKKWIVGFLKKGFEP